MKKLVMVLLDGCGDTLARENCGFLEHMAESGQAARYSVEGQLPSMSRPLYATLLSGLPVYRHKIVNNMVQSGIEAETVFSLARAAGLSTAAAAYHWMYELFCAQPFNPLKNRFALQQKGAVQNGVYYFEDSYPDSHLFADALYLTAAFAPDFLLVHSMNIDDEGHKFGNGSKQQEMAAIKADTLLSFAIPQWLGLGYQVLVTADHGMSKNGLHGGNTAEQRQVPLYLFGTGVKIPGPSRKPLGQLLVAPFDQLLVAPLACRLLGLAPAAGMQSLAEREAELLYEE